MRNIIEAHRDEICMETERLIMRRWRASDLEPFAAMGADPRVMEFFPSCLSREESAANISLMEDRFERNGFCFWALERKEDGVFLGFTGLNRPGFAAPFMPSVEVGWRLAFSHWGQGYASEAGHASVAYAFDNLRESEVVAFTARDNKRSRAVMERLGMTYDLVDDFDHPGLPPGHDLQRHVLYRIRRV